MLLQFCALGVTMSWDERLPGSAGVPPAQSLAQPRSSPPLGSTGNGAMAVLRPGRCCSRRQGGCLQHRTGAQRRPKGEDAGGTPALPGDAVPAVRWGVSGGRLLRKPTCTFGETPDCPRAGPSPCRADHSRKNGRSFMKMNHECTRIDTKTDGPSSTTSGTRMLLQSCALGVTMSWDEGLLGARASRPHQAWHSLGHLPHLDQPGTAPWLSYGLAAAVPCRQ